MKKIILAFDSFKGCLTAQEACRAAEAGVKAADPGCETLCLPLADGGEGMLDLVVEATGGVYRHLTVTGPGGQPVAARYGVSDDGRTALVELASASGLPLLPVKERNPWLTTTYGTGELIRDALERGCRHVVVGLGGSATNDAGLGLLQALGFRFLDGRGRQLGRGGQILEKVASIDTACLHPALAQTRFTVACDVRNPLYGPEGAAYVYAPQKGADQAMVARLDAGLQSLASLISRTTGRDIGSMPGAGAAGGTAAALMAFLHAELIPGIRLMMDRWEFSRRITEADLIITGEGRADRQTVMGKVASGVLAEGQKAGIPVILVAGSVTDSESLNVAGFRSVFSIQPEPVSLEKALQPTYAAANLSQVVTQLVRAMSLSKPDCESRYNPSPAPCWM